MRTPLLVATLVVAAAAAAAVPSPSHTGAFLQRRTGPAPPQEEGSPAVGPIPRRVSLRIDLPGGPAPEGLSQPVSVDSLRALRTFLERVDVTETAAGVSSPGPGPRSLAATASDLAGWEDAHRFVRDAVRHVPYGGNVRGADGALESRAANALDQALLLHALLRARGIEARLMRGRLDWESARRLVLGAAEPGRPGAADPWPRWVEIAADHWWVEAETGEETVVLDPAFSGAEPGSTPGREGRAVEEVPGSLRGRLHVAVVRGDLTLTEAELGAPEVVGGLVELELVPVRPEDRAGEDRAGPGRVAGARAGDAGSGRGRDRAGPGDRARREAGGAVAAGPAPRPADGDAPFREPLVVPGRYAPPRGPWSVRLRLPGRTLEVGPLEDGELANLELRLHARMPYGPAQRLDVPWGAGGKGRLTVVIGAGAVSAERLAGAARPVYRALVDLARAEVAARDALRPPLGYREGLDGLRSAAEGAWETFGKDGPAALGWALLRALDDVHAGSAAGRVLHPGLRMVAVRWRPPAPDVAASLALNLEDPVVVGQIPAGLSPERLQSAHGLLQAAALSQALHELAGEPPLTAFDVTLRAVGTGVGMGWFRDPGQLPSAWPDTIRAVAADDLVGGHLLIGPRRPPPAPALGAGMGWWQVGAGGDTRGKVLGPVGPRHAWVEMPAGGWTDLDGLLGSLPTLHRGLRWLAGMAAGEGAALRVIAGSACASAALVGSTLGREAPAGWPVPAVDAYCGPRR